MSWGFRRGVLTGDASAEPSRAIAGGLKRGAPAGIFALTDPAPKLRDDGWAKLRDRAHGLLMRDGG